ncbi:MAG: hypothetical protein HY594_01865 [Candidatus Omnitrophica bacterium]|nr:hypothetical protein [Candidatus Omnitrophota bacterium]
MISEHPPLLPVYLEIKERMTLQEFARQFGATLLFQYGAASGRQVPESFSKLCDASRPYIPETVSLLAQAVSKARRSPAQALELLFEAPGKLRHESGRLCVILLDEFHRLNAWKKSSAFTALGKQIMVQKETMYLMASSSVEEAKRILQERLAILFGHFQVVSVEPFDLPTGVAFLTGQSQNSLDQKTVIALADLLQGQPARLNALAPHLREGGGVAAALAHFLLDPESPVTLEYERKIREIPEARHDQAIRVLLAIVQGGHRVPALPQATGLTPFAIARALRWLMEAGWVVREGMLAYLPDRLFCFWLRSTYRVRHGLVQTDLATMGQWFALEVQQWLDRTVPKGPQDVLELLANLLKHFQNDWVEMNGRRVRLPKLEVHTLLLPGLPRSCVGHREDGSWFCIPSMNFLTESDAIHLVQTLRHVSKPWRRRIVVAAQGLEVNARLFLQEHKFWVWELEDLNNLLELYGLSRLIPTEISPPATVAAVSAAPDPAVPSASQAAAS